MAQVFFAESVYVNISGEALAVRGFKDYCLLLSAQTLIHATGFVVWPISLLLGLPFPWVFAFYHYSAISQGRLDNAKMVLDQSWRYANHWPIQNNILILLFFLLYIVIFINVSVVLYLIPQLLKDLLDIDSLFVLSGLHFLNTTFLAIACSLTYLLVNPIIKTSYVIRYFDGNSIQFGNDIKTQLQFLKSIKLKVLIAFVMVMGTTANLWASEASLIKAGRAQQPFTSEAFNRSIDRVLATREFAWRMPLKVDPEVEKKASSNSSWKWLYAQMKKIRLVVHKMLRKVWKWLRKYIFRDWKQNPKESKWEPLRLSKTLYVLMGLMMVVMGTALIVIWKIKKKGKTFQIQPPVNVPDIRSDTIKADDLLTEQWLDMANNLLNQGDLRHAVRAFYLGTLSHLARAQMITIKRYKSNYDYEMEIKRRFRDKDELGGIFSRSIVFLNSVWYGNRSLQAGEVLEFAREQEKIIELANA